MEKYRILNYEAVTSSFPVLPPFLLCLVLSVEEERKGKIKGEGKKD